MPYWHRNDQTENARWHTLTNRKSAKKVKETAELMYLFVAYCNRKITKMKFVNNL